MISMNKYNRLMEHINVTPDMLVRAHAALDAGKQPKSTRNTVPLRRYGALAACLAVVICGASLLNRQPQDDPVQALPPSATGEVVECGTTAELAENLPFTLRLPMELPGGYACTGAADSFGTATVRYEKGEDSICYYMGEGESAFDGIYPTGEKRTLTAKDAALYEDSTGYIVEWTDGDYSFALITTEKLSDDELCAMIESVK